MYSPLRMPVCYGINKELLSLLRITYHIKLAVSLDLPLDEEETTVDEQGVSLPFPWILMSLSIDGSRHWPDSSSSHIDSVFSLLIIIYKNY